MKDTNLRPPDSGSDITSYTQFAPCEISEGGLWKTRLADRLADELTPAIIARFHTKYEKSATGCWLWKFGCYPNGYGQFMVSRVDGRQLNVQAHRVAYLLAHGDLIDGLVVMHSCDTPACVNPAHLSQDTQGVNVRDAAAKGHYSGSRRGSACKLTMGDVTAIRASFAKGVDLARAYGVTKTTISLIRNGHRRKAA